MSSADIAACFPSEHDSLLGTDVESRRRSSKPFYLTRSSLETRKKEQGGLAGWWARFGEGGTIFDAFLMEASQQVGQSLLTLPWAFSLMGYGWAITSLLGLSLISMYDDVRQLPHPGAGLEFVLQLGRARQSDAEAHRARPTSTHGQGHELGLYIDYTGPRARHGRLGLDQDDGREGQGVRAV